MPYLETYGTVLNEVRRIQARIDAKVVPLLDAQLDYAGIDAPLTPAPGHTVAELVAARIRLWRASYEYWNILGACGCAEQALRQQRMFEAMREAGDGQ